jgi:peroxiredoxin
MSDHPTYADQRDEMQRTIAEQAPRDVFETFAGAAARLDRVNFAARAPKVGERAPSFVLPNQRGQMVALVELLANGPVVLIFYRGDWCPYCNLQLRTFQASLDEISARGARLVAVSPQKPDHSLSMAEKNQLGFDVLSDGATGVIDRYGLRYDVEDTVREVLLDIGNDVAAGNGSGRWELPAPATFVIASDGTIAFAEIHGDWTQRTEPDTVIAVLDELTAPGKAAA